MKKSNAIFKFTGFGFINSMLMLSFVLLSAATNFASAGSIAIGLVIVALSTFCVIQKFKLFRSYIKEVSDMTAS